MSIVRLLFSRRWWWTTLLVLIAIGVTVRLGFWQVARYHENEAIAEHLVAMQSASPVTLTGKNAPADILGMEYRPVQATGAYDFSRQIAIRNQIWLQVWGNDVGYDLVTPLVFPDGSAILVDRGWIPMADNTPSSWHQFDQPGQITVRGIVRLSTKPEFGGEIVPTLAPGETVTSLWNLIDIPSLQKQISYSLLPVYIQEAPDPAFTALPYRSLSQPDPTSASTNVGYALTWFSFAALLFGGYPLYLRNQDKKKSIQQQ